MMPNFSIYFAAILIFSLASGLKTLNVPLNGHCTKDPECGLNAGCNNENKCVCDFGSLPAANKIDCDLYRCKTNSSCTDNFPHSICVPKIQTCVCDVVHGWELDLDTQKCYLAHHPLNSNCTSNSDCGYNAYCNKDRKCACALGAEPDPAGTNCQYLKCSSDSECTSKWGVHTICTKNFINSNDRTCACNYDSGWKTDSSTQTCVPMYQFINGPCNSMVHCGTTGTKCNTETHKCQCRQGQIPDPIGKINCHFLNCQTNTDCEALDKNSHCFEKFCFCNTGFKVSDGTQTCVKSGVERIYLINFVLILTLILAQFINCLNAQN